MQVLLVRFCSKSQHVEITQLQFQGGPEIIHTTGPSDILAIAG